MRRIDIFKQVKVVGLMLALSAVAACANAGVSPPNGVINATVEFGTDGCPTAVNENLTSTGKSGQRIIFTSNPLMTGDRYNDFQLTFDPFVGRPYKSNKAVLRTQPLSGMSTPSKHKTGQTKFDFKYVINAEGCEPIDPRIIIDL
jgi:hypothetical protein